MKAAVQKRTLQTRARMLKVAEEMVADQGFEALRIEELVAKAGVAKGTFFSHFRDKDVLMALMIGARLDGFLDTMENQPAPQTVKDLVNAEMPMMTFLTSERYVFDIFLRYSGAVSHDDPGPIAERIMRHGAIVTGWLQDGPFRRDIPALLLAEGVEAFAIQSMALQFCGLQAQTPLEQRLTAYLEAWMLPSV